MTDFFWMPARSLNFYHWQLLTKNIVAAAFLCERGCENAELQLISPTNHANSIYLIEHPRFARNYSLYNKVTNPEMAVRMVPKTAVKDCDEL